MEGVGENWTRFFSRFFKTPEKKKRLKPGKKPEKTRLKPGKHLLEKVESTQKVGDLVMSWRTGDVPLTYLPGEKPGKKPVQFFTDPLLTDPFWPEPILPRKCKSYSSNRALVKAFFEALKRLCLRPPNSSRLKPYYWSTITAVRVLQETLQHKFLGEWMNVM